MADIKKFHQAALELIENENLDGLEALPIGQLIAAADEQRELKRALDRQAKDAGELFKILEATVLKKIIDSGTEETPCIQSGAVVDGFKITATVSENEVPTAENWEQIYAYIKENDAFELLQKRLSAKACLEAANFEDIEGMSFFTQKKLALRRSPM